MTKPAPTSKKAEPTSIRPSGDSDRRSVSCARSCERASALETRRHFDVVAEDLRHDIRGVAEGVSATFERVDRLGSELRTEMDQRFAAAHAVVRVACRDVRLDIADLRSRL